MASALLTGEVRISNAGNVYTKTLAALTTVSTWHIQHINLAAGVSDFIVSLAHISNPNYLVLMATSVTRVNYSGGTQASAGSAGQQFRDLYAQIGSGISGVTGLHLCNSTADSAVVTVVAGM